LLPILRAIRLAYDVPLREPGLLGFGVGLAVGLLIVTPVGSSHVIMARIRTETPPTDPIHRPAW
jgi:hypothetical protein